MLVENAIKLIHSAPDGWVRVEQIRRFRGGLELRLGIYRGRRGKRAEVWHVRCLGVREASITDLDGGGLAVYKSTHLAAKQYVARQAELRWPGGSDQNVVLAALYRAHIDAVDDWIAFDRYLPIYTPWTSNLLARSPEPNSEKKFVYRGPGFLIRAYARALRIKGERVQVTTRKVRSRKSGRPKVLHFGESFVVADRFAAQRQGVDPAPTRRRRTNRISSVGA